MTSTELADNAMLYMTQSDWEQHLDHCKQKNYQEYQWLQCVPSKGVVRVPPFSPSSKPVHFLRFREHFDDGMRPLTNNMADLVDYVKDISSEESYLFEPFAAESLLTENDLEECLMSYLLNSYSFDRYKTKGSPTPRAKIAFPETRQRDETLSLARACYFAQDLISTPACDLTPGVLQSVTEEWVRQDKRLSMETVVGADLLHYHGSLSTTRGCEMIYNVGKAAKDEDRQPRLLCIHYQPHSSESSSKTICLVGKGVTYDTGGLNLKPGSSMLNMKKDMGGAANVLGLLMALVEQNFPHQVRVWVPAVENVMDADSYRPGDVLTSANGKSTEIGNTDAEGRLILADALALASAEHEVDLIVDFATLTGAARVAMGQDIVPFFSNTREYSDGLAQAAKQAHDPVWELPLWNGYRERITSSSRVADLRNVPSDNGLGGAITAALYLQEFVGEKNGKQIPWIHLDVYAMEGTSGIGKAQGLRSMFRFLSDNFCDE